MKTVFKFLLATLCFTQSLTALAQSIYAIDKHSPIIIKYDADLNLASKKTTPVPKCFCQFKIDKARQFNFDQGLKPVF
jgi:hypothetical protein